MFATTFLALQESDFFGWLIDNHDADGWEETAQSWFFAAIVIAVICAGIMLLYKWLKKRSAENIDKKIWSRGQTIVMMMVGLAPVLLMMSALWYSTRDYFDVVGVGGLLKGIVFGWLLYLILMFLAHLASPWRREIL
jgi:hypothetical protein